MVISNKSQPGDYEIEKQGNIDILKINCQNYPYLPSVEDNAVGMSVVIDKLIEMPSIQRIILLDRRNYEYDYDQTRMLMEIANLYKYLIKEKKILNLSLSSDYFKVNLQTIIMSTLKSDPVGAYIELKRLIRDEKIKIENTEFMDEVNKRTGYINILTKLLGLFEDAKIISLAKPYLDGYEFGSRSIYKQIFKPTVTPDFMFTKLMAQPPMHSEEVDAYSIGKTEINIFKIPEQIQNLYHVIPPEFKLEEEKYELLDLARSALAEHQPKREEMIDPERMRQTFYNIGRDMIQELAEHKGIELRNKELNELGEILVRYTVGFGLIEILLEDPKIQDITINGPIGETPMFVVHEDYDECITNLYPSSEDGESWASKFRILSGRPLDEANPVLDTELMLPKARARVGIMTRPLNPSGLAYAFRRHRDKPWTYPLFIKNRMLSPLAAGLLSFLVDGNRTLLFAGTRSSGKTSILGSTLVEIMRKYRIITIEDTEELPVDALRKMNYNIQSMKVRSALTKASAEMEADEGIRTSLRFGDSALIVGEIRSTEALALYEAMRIGALSNVVAGTIHGANPYGVFDRVVNDLGVPRTSFKATDIIIISNPIRSADGLHKQRRVLSISEVRKNWEDDPIREKGFVDLMKYNSKTDSLEPTPDLMNGDSEIIKEIAGNVKEWIGNWDAVWDNILLRAKIKETLVNYALKLNQDSLLESEFVIESNDMFHRISDSIREKTGNLDSKKIYFEWHEWLKRALKKSII
ncbi:type II/IV secretion system ATPase subunit [Candidatus Woesearchaeota archaeon]|nr:type II/IV secretion system ATPase subunit [Candidatus Woesearchaeota archaeon]